MTEVPTDISLKRLASCNDLTLTSITALLWESWDLGPPLLSLLPNKIHTPKESLIKMPQFSLLFGTDRHHMQETRVIGGIRSKYHRPHVPLVWNSSAVAMAQAFGQCLICRMGEENMWLLALLEISNHLNEWLPPRMTITPKHTSSFSSQNYKYKKKKI